MTTKMRPLRGKPIRSMKFRKKPVAVDVCFAQSAGTLQTLEGLVKFIQGDALTTGVQNERWPIPRKHFESTYAPVWPTLMGTDGRYIKKPSKVTALQCGSEQHVSIGDGNGVLRAKVGDWIVTDGAGNRWVVADSIFRATYESVPN